MNGVAPVPLIDAAELWMSAILDQTRLLNANAMAELFPDVVIELEVRRSYEILDRRQESDPDVPLG